MNEKDILLDNKKQEYSISFMKIFFSYCVVCSHFYNAETAIIKSSYAQSLFHRMQITAVPVFIIISFFLTEKHYTEQRYDKFIQRIGRLLIPYWGWAFLYYIGYKVIDFFLGLSQMEQLNPSLSYKDFLLQLAFGSDRNLCPPLWYLFDLIFLTSVFWIINKYWGNYVWYIIPTMGIFALCLQYSGINYHLFGNLVYEIRWTLGRIMEVLPYACIGTIMSHFNMVERMKRRRVFVFVIGIILMIMIADLKIFTVMTEDFGYGGLALTGYATLTFAVLLMIPFDNMRKGLKSIFRFLSKYSLGVFCLHFGVGYCLNALLGAVLEWKNGTFAECIGIYGICVILSWIISLIPIKYVKQLVE